MAGATTTTAAAGIKTTFEPGFAKTFYDGVPLIKMFGSKPNLGGDSIDWKVKSAGNTSGTTYTEGQAPSAAGYVTVADATVAHEHFRTMVQITGHLRDALNNGYYDAVAEEMQGGNDELLKTVEDTFIATLEAAVDSAGSYAGLLRATYNLASHESAVGTLALSDLQTLQETMLKVPRATPMNDFILMSTIDMYNEYMDVGGGVAYHELNVNMPDGSVNAGKVKAQLDDNGAGRIGSYGNIPWFIVPTMTATTILGVRPSKMIIEEARKVQIDLMAKNDDSDTYSFTWAGQIALKDTYRAAKLT